MYDQEQYSALVQRLEGRFLAHPERHPALSWAEAASRLEDHPEALETLALMEQTGGEPDVIGRDAATGEILFCDCSAETPAGRRSLCYDQAARLSRKKGAPGGQRHRTGRTHGACAADGGAVPGPSGAGRVRPEDLQLDLRAGGDPPEGRRCSASGATAGSLPSTTARTPTTPSGAGGGSSGCKRNKRLPEAPRMWYALRAAITQKRNIESK